MIILKQKSETDSVQKEKSECVCLCNQCTYRKVTSHDSQVKLTNDSFTFTRGALHVIHFFSDVILFNFCVWVLCQYYVEEQELLLLICLTLCLSLSGGDKVKCVCRTLSMCYHGYKTQ